MFQDLQESPEYAVNPVLIPLETLIVSGGSEDRRYLRSHQS
jgi:hypothetical protein